LFAIEPVGRLNPSPTPEERPMFAFPLVAAIVSVACFATVAFDYFRRPKPDKPVWSIAFALFSFAVLCKIIGETLG
jgi:hypothetical protein